MALSIISILMLIIYCFLRPYSDGFADAGLWMAKILAPIEDEDSAEMRQLVKLNQAAIVDGWPSTVPLAINILAVAGVIIGFVAHWWVGLIAVFLWYIVSTFLKPHLLKDVTYFITLLCHRMTNRIADYRKGNDFERASAAQEVLDKMNDVLRIYSGSGAKVPSPKLIKQNPYGDIYFLWTLYHGDGNKWVKEEA